MKLSTLAIIALAAASQSVHATTADFKFPIGMEAYDAGIIVEHKDRLFECKEFPNSGFCKQWSVAANSYEPGVGFAWEMAWNEVTPVTDEVSYHFDFPEYMGIYGAGVIVQNDGEAYRCKEFPYSGFCQQWSESDTQYEPGVGFAWEMAWEHLGKAGNKTSKL